MFGKAASSSLKFVLPAITEDTAQNIHIATCTLDRTHLQYEWHDVVDMLYSRASDNTYSAGDEQLESLEGCGNFLEYWTDV